MRAPGQSGRAIVNAAAPQVPASLYGVVTGVVGLDGLFHERDMLERGHAATATTESPQSRAAPAPGAQAHASTPQACAGAESVASGGTYTSTQLSSLFGLDQLFAEGRTGIGQSIAVVEFEQYAASDFAAFEACYGLSNSIRNVQVDGGAGGPGAGRGRGRARYGTGRFQRPLRLARRLRGAQR